MNDFLLRIGFFLILTLMWVAQALAQQAPQISINGGPAVLRDNVRQYLSIADENCAAPEWRLKALLNDAQNEIENAAQAVGFYQIKFTTKLTAENGCWQLQVDLTPGPQVVVKDIDIRINGEGTGDEAFKQIQTDPGIPLGDRLNHGAYENLKNRLGNLATARGYFDGRFEENIVRVDVENSSADIDLAYDTGARYRIGEIRMHHKILSEKFLRRYLNIKEGDYYDADKLLELKAVYNASNYFSVATASPDLQNLQNNEVPIDVQLEERKRHAYSIGAGVSTDTGARLLLGYEDRYINNRGHSVKADVSTSNVKETAEIGYTIPMKRPQYEFVKIYGGYDNEKTDTSYSNKNALGISYGYYQQHSRWLTTYAVNIENEESCAVCPGEVIYTHLIIPSVTVSRTENNSDLAYPTNGWRLLARLSGSPKSVGSDVSYEQFYANGKYIFPFMHGRLLLRSEFGVTDVNGSEDTDDLPVSKRFYAGGDSSVRGYDYKSLGPTEKYFVTEKGQKIEKEKVVGGNNLLVSSIEYDYRIKPTWAVAAFYDLGNAADDFKLHFKSGVGVGVRYISPIGPIRIDIARALQDPKGWNLHISMGPDL